jgi:PKD repeat protein
MDNSMAISHNGFIVSGINTNLVFTQPDGQVRYTAPLADFFKILGLGTRMYDPRIIYDTESRRFIIMCMNGSDPSTTALVIAFSQTEDPTGRWKYYRIDGNPLNDNYWSDYPNVSISKKDLYISTLLRDTNGDWNYSMVFQMSKDDGYSGKPLRWKYYADPKNADGNKAFNLVPTPNGWSDLIGPGMHFVSNEPLGGNKYNYYQTTGSIDDNPSLLSFQTTGLATELAPNGRQKGSNEVLNTFDSRIWSALYLDGIIHMGGHVNTPEGNVGLLYGRYDIKNLKVDATVLTESNIDYGFPSFTAFGTTAESDTILVNYLISGTERFAGQQQRTVAGKNENFIWSDAANLKDGETAISAIQGNEERWGDYSTACRRFLSDRVESWVVGMHSESKNYATWIGQLAPAGSLTTQPRADFVADKTTTDKNVEIRLTDITAPQATSWSWMLPGANPSTSLDQNPTITYAADGSYDVTLIVTTIRGIDTVYKKDFIHIQAPLAKPVVDFTYDNDTIFVGETVKFKSAIQGEVDKKKWTFQGGVPLNSDADSVVVKYNSPGSYLVVLTAENIAGSSIKNKSKAVTVLTPSSTVEEFDIKSLLYPNPIKRGEIVTLEMTLLMAENIVIDVHDQQGRFIHRLYDDKIKSGLNRLRFESSQLKSGLYSVRLSTATKQQSLQFIIFE